MPRLCAGRFTPPAESNKSLPLHAMRPRSGATSPAAILTIVVLPEPEGPNSAVTPSAASNFAAIVNSPSCFSTSTLSISAPVQPHAGAAREPFGANERDQRDHDCDQHQPPGRGVPVRDLRVGIDR